MKITVLGCGTSSGVPMIGCDCAVCRSQDHRNRRRRVSVLVESGGARLLIDTPPDLHAQLVDAEVSRLDAVLYTHGHADHVHGIDDLRSINFHMGQALDAYGSAKTLAAIKGRFAYAFEPMGAAGWAKPSLNPVEIDGPFTAGGVAVLPFPQEHGRSITTGYRIGDIGVFDRREGVFGRGLRRARWRGSLDCRLPRLPRTPDACAPRSHARMDRAGEAAARGVDAHVPSVRLRDAASRIAGGRGAGLRRAYDRDRSAVMRSASHCTATHYADRAIFSIIYLMRFTCHGSPASGPGTTPSFPNAIARAAPEP